MLISISGYAGKTMKLNHTIKGANYAVCPGVATIKKFWNISRFPLDNHFLTIEVEDNENETFKLTYMPDTENSGAEIQVQVPGWSIVCCSCK